VTFAVERAVGAAAAFHARPLEGTIERAARAWEVEAPALVLGSTQPDAVVDRAACDAAGVAVVRRRSGGGAVLVEPGRVVWVDVELPRGDALWDDDVGRATWWLGECWAAAMRDLGLGAAVAHRGPMVTTPWSRLVCFGGLGPGEVVDGAGGPKVVGIAQRRTRAGARFQCAVNLTWEPERLLGLLALDAPARRAAGEELRGGVQPVAVPPGTVVDALVRALAAAG
jgi:lipoate-protein ligase A